MKYYLISLTLRQLQRLVGLRVVEDPFAVRVLVGQGLDGAKL